MRSKAPGNSALMDPAALARACVPIVEVPAQLPSIRQPVYQLQARGNATHGVLAAKVAIFALGFALLVSFAPTFGIALVIAFLLVLARPSSISTPTARS
jgi:hypothetical protein